MTLAVLLSACSDNPVGLVGEPQLAVVSAPPAVVAPGAVLTARVRAVDETGAPWPGLQLAWSGDGTVDPAAGATDPEGYGEATWVLPRLDPNHFANFGAGLPGTYRLQATALGLPAVQVTVEARALKLDQVDAGGGIACGVRNGLGWCWGASLAAALSAGEASAGRPVSLASLGTVSEVRASTTSVCARTPAGAVSCSSWWTGKEFVPVLDLPPVGEFSEGDDLYCGLALDGAAWCWQLKEMPAPRALPVPGGLSFSALEAGGAYSQPVAGFACGLDQDGAAWCWGRNQAGELGNGTTTPSATPVPVSGGLRFASIDVGLDAACGETHDGQWWCWGAILGTSVPSPVPHALTAGTRMAVGVFGAMAWTSTSAAAWYRTDEWYPRTGLIGTVPIRALSYGNQMCVITIDDDTYCSWILVRGGSDTSLFPPDLIAVPGPA